MRRVLVAAVLASITVPVATGSATAACGPPAWQRVATPNIGNGGNDLRGVTALSPTDAWAVGSGWDDAEDHSTALITHWDGAEWSLVDSPTVGDATLLSAVHGTATGDVWAVGTSVTEGNGRALIERWTGEAWEVVDAPAPSPEPTVTTTLTDVFALSGSDAWAVGRWATVPDSPVYMPLIERWDGADWEVVDAPVFEQWTGLNAVSASGPADVWFVGDTEVLVERHDAIVQRGLILHWDGEGLTRYPAPFNRRHPLNPFTLEDVVAISETDAWAVGEIVKEAGVRTISLHWDGVEWSRVPLPQPSPQAQLLAGVTALSPTQVWAVGLFLHVRSNEYRTLVYRWNGQEWRTMSSANRHTGGELFEVAAVEGFQVAVGQAWSNRLESYRTLAVERCAA